MSFVKNEKTVELVMSFTFMTDRFMSNAFDKEVGEYVLSIIMERPLKIRKIESQHTEDDVYSRGCRFDIIAEDTDGKFYNIEVQNADSGAVPERARFNCGRIDQAIINKGMKYQQFPEVYIIFITEHDVMGKGYPIYHYDRTLREDGDLFGDKQHIIYVNGECKNPNTPLGQLMLDMQQSDPSKISSKILADKMIELKQGKGLKFMCKEIDKFESEVTAEVTAKVSSEERTKAAEAMLDCGIQENVIIKQLVEKYHIPEDTAKEYINKAHNN